MPEPAAERHLVDVSAPRVHIVALAGGAILVFKRGEDAIAYREAVYAQAGEAILSANVPVIGEVEAKRLIAERRSA